MNKLVKGLTAAISMSVFLPVANADQAAPLVLAAAQPITSAEITGSVPEQLKVSKANVFNRLLKKIKDPNAAPPDDGVHDPANDAVHSLQPPKIAYEGI